MCLTNREITKQLLEFAKKTSANPSNKLMTTIGLVAKEITNHDGITHIDTSGGIKSDGTFTIVAKKAKGKPITINYTGKARNKNQITIT